MSDSPVTKLLGLKPAATPAQVRDAWRSLRAKIHPDRGGDPVHFAAVSLAVKRWLAAHPSSLCPLCHGHGRVGVQHGFKTEWIACPRCSRRV